jgi:PKD repeat protein
MGKYILITLALFLTFSISCRKKKGCTDKCANNYINAKEDDGTCSYDKPIVSLSYSIQGCEAPYLVTFYSGFYKVGCTGKFRWDFGDGVTSTDQTPKHIYNAPGIYTVTLHINNGTEEAGESMILRLDSYYAPIADFGFKLGNDNERAPCKVYFYNYSKFSETYFWDFGDGTSSTLQSPDHEYTSPGNYTITLQSSCGGKTSTRTSYFTVYDKPGTVAITAIRLVTSSTKLSSDKGTPLYAEVIYNYKTAMFSKIHNWEEYPATWNFPGDIDVGNYKVYDNFYNNDQFTFKIWLDELGLNDRAIYTSSVYWQYLSSNYYPKWIYWDNGTERLEVWLDYQ